MIPKKHKERKGKDHCDLCERTQLVIHEYEFRLNSHLAHWLDLCAECGAKDWPVRDGFLVGIHLRTPMLKPPAESIADACESASQRERAKPSVLGRSRRSAAQNPRRQDEAAG